MRNSTKETKNWLRKFLYKWRHRGQRKLELVYRITRNIPVACLGMCVYILVELRPRAKIPTTKRRESLSLSRVPLYV